MQIGDAPSVVSVSTPALPREGALTHVLFYVASPVLEVHSHVCLLCC